MVGAASATNSSGTGGLRSDTRRARTCLALCVLLFGAGGTVQAQSADGSPRLEVDAYSDRYDEIFRHYANRLFGPFVDWRWFKAQAVAESHLDARAESPVGARGLMQLMPTTFEEVRTERPEWGDIHSPQWNIAAGVHYDRTLYRMWGNRLHGQDRFLLMLASYNAGFYRVREIFRRAERVRTWHDIKDELPSETRAYIARIQSLMQPQPAPEKAVVASAVFEVRGTDLRR